MPRKKSTPTASAPAPVADPIGSIHYPAKRRHIPPAGLEAQGQIADAPIRRYHYNPHLPPVLRIADDPPAVDALPELLQTALQRPLLKEEAEVLATALRRHEPWLEWSGKREKTWFEENPVPLHIHERVSTQAILRVLARQEVQRSLFADPELDYHEAVKFYLHDVDWANRMILGDSLQVMASLARREDLAGKVQMIYFDPPYGIKFASNFQPRLGQRDVKDRVQDLTREPEMVKAYRDTWTLGVHSYLAYLRDRLAMAKELLTDSGSIFVQISDENLHRVRCLLDEVFKPDNYVALIQFQKTTSATNLYLPVVADHILWYAKDIARVKYRPLFKEKTLGEDGTEHYTMAMLDTGEQIRISQTLSLPATAKPFTADNLTSASIGRDKGPGAACWFPVTCDGKAITPNEKNRWKTNEEGMARLLRANRVLSQATALRFVRFLDDFAAYSIHSIWSDVGGASDRLYIVQTSNKVIERCLLMTTDPGDLVLDPTCGSGTTAYVAEHWGRRWITIDTSRVALALARQRLLTAKFPYFKLRPLNPLDLERNPRGTWLKNGADDQPRTLDCKSVPHVTLKSVARNTALDPIFTKHEPILTKALADLNAVLQKAVNDGLRETLAAKLDAKVLDQGVKAVTDGDCRRWLLPGTKPFHIRQNRAAKFRSAIPPEDQWRDWEVPFDVDPDWPPALAAALEDYRRAWRAKMDEVNACIAANADSEELVDKPEEIKAIVRVSGPFTMEGVIAIEQGPDSPIGGAPEDLETFGPDGGAGELAVVNAEAHLDKILRLLNASGVDFPGNKTMRFERLEPVAGGDSLIHAEGQWANGDGQPRLVAVSVGPETGNLSAFQVEDVIRSANRRGYDEVVFAAFGFDAAAQAAIEEAGHPKLRLHMALIRPDVAMAELLKTQPGSQIFTVFSAPRIKGPQQLKDKSHVVEVQGMDVYDPVSGSLYPTDKDQIAAWFLDGDYDGRTFCICQAFFPDKSKWEKLAKALGDKGVVDTERFAALSGLQSLPFSRPGRLKQGEPWRIAVKVIDPRGNEGLRVVDMDKGGWPYA